MSANGPAHPSSPGPSPAPAIALCLAFVGAGLGGLAITPDGPEAAVADFTPPRVCPDSTTLDPLWDADRATWERYPLDEVAQEALSAFEALGAAELKAGGRADDGPFLEATERAVEALSVVYARVGEEGYRALGQRVEDRFVRAVMQVLARAHAERVEVRDWLYRNATDPMATELAAVGGTFLNAAVDWGLIRDGRVREGCVALLRVHFRLRWARFVNDIKDYTMLLRRPELLALWRWRVEGDVSLPKAQRLEVVRWIRDLDPSYPAVRRLSLVFASLGDHASALEFAREAVLQEPFDATLRANLDALLAPAP